MKKLLIIFTFLLAPSLASAQCNGVFPNNTACGNITGSSNTPRPVPLSSFPTTTPGGATGQIQYNNSGAFGGFTANGGATINTTTGLVTINYSLFPAQAAKTANYQAAFTDCNSTLVYGTGSTPQITATLPTLPATGFNPGCTIAVKNNDVYTGIGTGHADTLAGFPTDLFTLLYPQQVTFVTVNAAGTGWITIINPGRWKLPTSAEICVAQNGNDVNDGLGSGTGCMQSPQNALGVIGQQWDGGGYNACSMGFYVGGTSILAGNVTQTGQSIGCFITINIRGSITWASTGACYTGGDNSITIVNWTFGSIPTFACNTANTVSTGQFKCHQYCVFDLNGGTAIWLPGGASGVTTHGSNDVFFDLDLQGSATYNGTVDVGDGVNTYAPAAFIQCESHCSKVTVSGSLASSAFVTFGVIYNLRGGSVITTTATYPGVTATNPTTPTGHSVLIINGTTIPGGTSPSTGFPAQNSNFGLVCNTLC